MGHHLDDQDRFQSDKHPDLDPDKIILSFHDPAARAALRTFARNTSDQGLACDIHYRLNALCDNDEKLRESARSFVRRAFESTEYEPLTVAAIVQAADKIVENFAPILRSRRLREKGK